MLVIKNISLPIKWCWLRNIYFGLPVLLNLLYVAYKPTTKSNQKSSKERHKKKTLITASAYFLTAIKKFNYCT